MKPLTIFLLLILCCTVVFADTLSPGTFLKPAEANVTYQLTETITCTRWQVDDYCVTITGGDFDGSYCDTSIAQTTTLLGAPIITQVNLTLENMLYGNQSYLITYNATDVDGDTMTCTVQTQEGTVSLTWNATTKLCHGRFNLTQTNANTIVPKASDGTTTTSGATQEGMEIIFNAYLPDTSQPNTLTSQHFLRQYNFTNHMIHNATDLRWSLNATDPVKTSNFSIGLTQNNQTTFQGDFIQEDDQYTFSGSVFLARSTYTTTLYLTYNNTKGKPLPDLYLTVPLRAYNDTFLAEKQSGILWPDLNYTINTTTAKFNISSVNSSQDQRYRFSYHSFFIEWSGEISSNYRLSGSNKEWTLDRVYKVNFNLTGKSVVDYILQANLNEWVSKTGTWGSTLEQQSTASAWSHTTTDYVTYAELDFAAPLDNYTYQILYYTPLTSSSGGGGGGGGGASPPSTTPDTTQTTDTAMKFGKIIFEQSVISVPVIATPDSQYKEMIITANGTIGGVIEFSDSLQGQFKADVCDVGGLECSSKVAMQDGDVKVLRILGEIPEEWGDTLATDQFIEGQLVIRTPTTASPLLIVVEPLAGYAPVHGFTKFVNEDVGITMTEKYGALILGIVAILIGIGLIITISKMMG